jgi:hypothetical protein
MTGLVLCFVERMVPLFLLCQVNHEVHALVSVQCMVPLFLLCRVNHEVHDLDFSVSSVYTV